jgi:heme-degrading monooxygenase HmoA
MLDKFTDREIMQPFHWFNTEDQLVITIDLETNPDLQFRIDNFFVPEGARAEFEQAMQRNLAFLETLPGFRGHLVFEKTSGPSAFHVATIAVWESREAVDAAGEKVRAYYESIGFDPAALMSKLGIKGEMGNFRAVQG